jgi:hypothetical protein
LEALPSSIDFSIDWYQPSRSASLLALKLCL